jgi:hypothetical protein
LTIDRYQKKAENDSWDDQSSYHIFSPHLGFLLYNDELSNKNIYSSSAAVNLFGRIQPRMIEFSIDDLCKNNINLRLLKEIDNYGCICRI